MWTSVMKFLEPITANIFSSFAFEEISGRVTGKKRLAAVLAVLIPLLAIGGIMVWRENNVPPEEPEKAYAWYLKKVAENPSPKNLTNVGECCLFGRGTDVNYDTAFSCFEQAAKEGYAQAQYDLGLCYEFGYGTGVDDVEALSCFREAEEEVPDAAAHVAYYYYRGWGRLQNDKGKAWNLLALAEERGSAVALYFQTLYYLEERNGKDYLDKAIECGRKAVEGAGYEKACGPLGLCYLELDPAKAIEYFERGAEENDDIALYQLALCYQNGPVKEKDETKAFEYFEKAAARGNVEANNVIGSYYYTMDTDEGHKAACRYYKTASDRNYGHAAYILAWLTEHGYNGPANVGQAIRLYNKAVELGISDAQVYLADLYNNETNTAKDPGKAFEQFQKAADEGNSYAQRMVGYFYEHGIAMERPDTEMAKEWYGKAAGQGDTIAMLNLAWILYDQEDYTSAYERFNYLAHEPTCLDDAQYALGEFFYYGHGDIKQDYEQAGIWYQKAAEQNHPRAMVQMGRLYDSDRLGEPDYEKAYEYYLQAAESGYDGGQYWVAECLAYGRGVEKDIWAAIGYYKKSANQEYVYAQQALADIYSFPDYYGGEVEKDLATAAEWLRRAAENGGVRAQARLGSWYYWGEAGVPMDREKAVEYLMPAAEQGDANSQELLGHCYSSGQGGLPVDKEKAVELYTQAAEQGDASSQYYLAKAFFYGEGVKEADQEEALKWLRAAEEQNEPEALHMLGSYYENGWARIKVNQEEAERYYKLAAENGYRGQ